MTECVDSTTKGAEKNANAAVEESSLINTTPNADSGMPQATADSGISVSGPGRQIEMITVDQLAPYAGNARTHTKKQIRQLAKSIERFGFTNPILMDDHGQVIAGHGRLEAAKLLGMNAVPTLRLSHLSEADKRAYLIADNRLAEQARWDRELLAIELQALVDLDFDVEVTGFQMGEIDIILKDSDEAKDEAAGPEDDVPEPLPHRIVSRRDDVWILGKHRLVCGDARDNAAYEQLLTGDKAELVITDPPYNVAIDGHVGGKGAIHHREFVMASGEMSKEAFTDFLTSVFACLATNTVPGSIHYAFMDWRHIDEMMAAGKKVYTEFKNLCVWTKTNAGMGTFYRSQHELVFVWKSGEGSHLNNFELGQHGRSRTNVWHYAGVNTMRPGRLEELAMHPTVKPVALVADAIKDCSRRGGLVLDPFCGSGTILIAAERTGRKARALEIDPQYVDVALRRWQKYTGKAATLAGTDETFEDIEELRTNPKLPGTTVGRGAMSPREAA
jgi:DNA modification methylase